MNADSGHYFDTLFTGCPVLGILRGFSPADTVARAQRAWDVGVSAVEVTIEVPEQLAALSAAVAAGRERDRPVGAGTIYHPDQLRAAASAGAAFSVAPGHDPQIAACSREHGLAHLPGVATPTEIHAALRSGHRWLKVFPASVLGTDYLRAMRGPFPTAKFVATGGIDARNAREFLSAGADVVAVGSALADPAQLDRLAELNAAR